MKSVYIVNSSGAYERMFRSLGYEIVNEIVDATLVCFTGGEDVDPRLYGDTQHRFTGCNPRRDEYEIGKYNIALKLGIPMVGICRGGQFLNVMNGGRMYQHVDGHTQGHMIQDQETLEEVYVSSTHHQMFMPAKGAIIVATAAVGGFREWYELGVLKRDTSEEDYEVLFYRDTMCLCFQPHPEFVSEAYEGMRKYFDSKLNTLLQQEE